MNLTGLKEKRREISPQIKKLERTPQENLSFEQKKQLRILHLKADWIAEAIKEKRIEKLTKKIKKV